MDVPKEISPPVSTAILDTVPERPNFSELEEAVLLKWSEIDAFKTSLKLSEGRKEYTFYDGPPFATGLPHYGHILAGTIKDVVTRYAHQTGHHVSRRFGWDCHGLPVEYEIDKKLGIKSSDDVHAMGIAAYNAECKSIVTRYCKEWEVTVNRLGRWIDFRNDYKTMEPWYMESVWWVFAEIHKKGLVYQGFKVMPYSTACNTPLSNFEANQNYQEVSDPAVVISFPLVEEPDVAILAWTTTPWTLPSNLAVCVHPDLTYVVVQDVKTEKKYIVAESRLVQLYPGVAKGDKYKGGEFTVLKKMVGKELEGKRYVPLFDYYAAFSASRKNCAFRVVIDKYVTDDSGTGIVHQAPAFGEDDYRVCMEQGIIFKGDTLPCPVDDNGRYTDEVPEWKGVHVKAADDGICARLKELGRLVNKSTIVHQYPFCWRSDTPLIYKAVSSWFVNVEAIKEDLLKTNDETYWVPGFVREKRFYNWLKDARDWAISRNRYWGTPLPIWISEDGQEVRVVSSIKELEELTGATVTDLHKEFIDHLTIPSSTGRGVLRRIPEVFDCWFESGSMPYAQSHYPFENKEKWEAGFPADFIAEGLDQTRGWFYTLMVLSTALFKKPAFKNLIVNGLVLAADGKKMSKRLNNYPPPQKCLDSYGADALRLYLIDSPVVRAESLKFKEEGVFSVVKDKLLPWYHAFRFFVENCGRFERENGSPFVNNAALAASSSNLMDKWVLATLNSLIDAVHAEMQAYRLYTVVPKLVLFLDDLTNWYVRLNRPRLKGSEGHEEARVALSTMYEVLMKLCQLMAPLTPFITEFMYQHLRKFHSALRDKGAAIDAVGKADSVHYTMLPVADAALKNDAIEKTVGHLLQVVLMGRKARERRNISLKKPILSLTVVHGDAAVLESLKSLAVYLHAELNMEDLTFDSEEKKWCKLYALPDNKALGKRLGKQLKEAKDKIAALSHEQLMEYEVSGKLTLGDITLDRGDLQIKREFSSDATRFEAIVSDDGKLMVIVDTTDSEELVKKGTVREVTNKVQKLRKAAGLNASDYIEVYYEVSGEDRAACEFLEAAITENLDMITSVLKPNPFNHVRRLPAMFEEIRSETEEINGANIRLVVTKPTVELAI